MIEKRCGVLQPYEEDFVMPTTINQVERISYAGGIYGLLFGSSKHKLQAKIEEMNQRGWSLHFIHPESVNLVILIFRLLLLIVTLGIWTIGSSELLIFQKQKAD